MRKYLLSFQLPDVILNESPYGCKTLSGNQKIYYWDEVKWKDNLFLISAKNKNKAYAVGNHINHDFKVIKSLIII